MRSVRCPTVARHERATRWTYGDRAHLPEAVRRLGVRLDVLLEGPSDDYARPVGMAQRTGVLWQRKQALTAPDAHDTHPLVVEPVDDAKGRKDDLSQQPFADLSGLLLCIPGAYRLEVLDGRGGEADAALARHVTSHRDAA